VLVASDTDCHATRRALESVLRERFELRHTTLQVDHEHDGGLLKLQLSERIPPQ
jgi:cobalt-zinc-cadmium efflux system protein